MSLYPEIIRDPDELQASALAVIDRAFASGASWMVPLFSGGNDSICASHCAAQHPQFSGEVHHIDTGIGARAARAHVEAACREMGWRLNIYKSDSTYEQFIRAKGFPGPGMHSYVYARLKERCVRQMIRGRGKSALITGARREESDRRMGYVEPVVVGELATRKDKRGRRMLVRRNLKRIWTSPCWDWSANEQRSYMNAHALPRNPLKDRLGVSGECFCGAFATPGELDRVRLHASDVAAEIDRLTEVARQCGKHDVWGTRPDREKGLAVVRSGPLCSGCDRRAAAAGLVFAPLYD